MNNPFITITLRSTLTRVIVPVEVPSRNQIELFSLLQQIIIISHLEQYSWVQIICLVWLVWVWFYGTTIICLNFWDEVWWFLSLRVFRLLSSSLLFYSQCFGQYVLRLSSVVCRTREPTQNFEPCPLFNPRSSLV